VTEAQASESVGGPAGAGAGTESPGPEEQPAAAAAAGEPETATVLAEADDAASAAPAASHDEEPAVDGDDAARLRRDELLAPVLTRLARALKRALQDDQNELLNAIRHASGAPDLEMLLPEDEQRERYALAASGALADGWLVGRSWLRADGSTILDDEAKVGGCSGSNWPTSSPACCAIACPSHCGHSESSARAPRMPPELPIGSGRAHA
jgi:hypothetical protein